jgi:hypothetical protein
MPHSRRNLYGHEHARAGSGIRNLPANKMYKGPWIGGMTIIQSVRLFHQGSCRFPKRRTNFEEGQEMERRWRLSTGSRWRLNQIENIRRKCQKPGRFVLATNDLDLDSDRMLANYKNQAQVERGFRFLKDDSFRVSEIFLKKNTRIEVLAMIIKPSHSSSIA